MAIAENAGKRRKTGQSLSDRLREIKCEEGWVDVSELLRQKLGQREQNAH